MDSYSLKSFNFKVDRKGSRLYVSLDGWMCFQWKENPSQIHWPLELLKREFCTGVDDKRFCTVMMFRQADVITHSIAF
jgi:hypothetical protein